MKKKLIIVYLMLQNALVFAHKTDTLIVDEGQSYLLTSNFFHELSDPNGVATIKQVLASDTFYTSENSLPELKYSKSTAWIKFILKNNSSRPFIPITISPSIIDEFDIYYIDGNNKNIHHLSADQLQDNLVKPNVAFINYPLLPGNSNIVYLRVKSHASSVIPIKVYSENAFIESQNTDNMVVGAIGGILIVMGMYNLMLYFVVGDRSYLYYVFYIFFLALSQAMLRGYGVYLFTGNKIILNNYIIPIIRVCFGFSVLFFVGEFLHLKQNLKRGYKYYLSLYVLYTLLLLAILCGMVVTAYNLITFSISLTSVSLLVIGVYLYLKGFKPAKFFLFGWSVFLISILVSVARNKGLIPYNDFTANIVPFCSIIELILFSAALAEKINFYRAQKNKIQDFAITIAKENERLTAQQNILLENKVKERTTELINTNKSLSVTIENLKNTQKQLIDTEKMASLGQLTAGVAHEINNPINFVSSNINPLRLDFNELFSLIDKYDEALTTGQSHHMELLDEYKQKIDPGFIRDEITLLLNGIEEGAKRTTEIVKSLRTFSSTDDLVLKTLDIDKAVYANLLILRSAIPYYIQVKTNLDTLEPLNCYPGKINQLLINLISNSVYAIKEKKEQDNERIYISTKDQDGFISIEITDTGTGMTKETKQRIFEPFFTTKNVGEGTGLGLSIVFGIIEKHKGSVEVISELGKGTTFIVLLPKNLS